MNAFIMETLFRYFKTEISNKVKEKNGELIVEFADGKKAQIKLISLV